MIENAEKMLSDPDFDDEVVLVINNTQATTVIGKMRFKTYLRLIIRCMNRSKSRYVRAAATNQFEHMYRQYTGNGFCRPTYPTYQLIKRGAG